MSDFTPSWQGYDFSGLGALLSRMQEITRPVMEAVQSIQSALKPIVEAIEQYRPKVAEIGQALLQATRPLSAIRKMGEAQFVFWDYMTDEFVDAIVDAENINKTLREQLIRDRFSTVNKTIDKTLSSAVMHIRQLAANSMTGASGRQRADLDFIKRIQWDFPDIETQKKISSALSVYDDLIEVNNKRIKTLEQMAENLYKEWFVRFRFPGHETAEFENGIPKGWAIKRLGDYGRVETGKTPSMEVSEYYGNDYLFIKTPEMHGNVFVINTEEKLSKRGHSSQPKKLLPANSIMVTCIGTGGIVAINAEPGHTNQQINSIILDDLKYLEWLFFTCRSMRTTIEMFGATGSTMTNLSKGKFEKLKVIEPSTALIEEFHKITESMLKEIEKLMRANQKLACQRDLLLPRLMSGKLEV